MSRLTVWNYYDSDDRISQMVNQTRSFDSLQRFLVRSSNILFYCDCLEGESEDCEPRCALCSDVHSHKHIYMTSSYR